MSERTLSEVWEEVLEARFKVAGGVLAGVVLAMAFVFTVTPYYRVQMIVAPLAQAVFQAEEAPRARYGEAGEPVLTADFLRFENMLGGASAAAVLLQDEKIRKGLSYDHVFPLQQGREDWNAEALAEYIQGRVRLEPVGQTPLRRLVYMHPSREFGVYFLHRLHTVTDGLIRSNTREQAAGRIAYLEREIAANPNPEHRRVLTDLLLEQERARMLSSIDQSYAADIIEPPASSARARWPDAVLVFPVFVFIGALAGFLLHGIGAANRQMSRSFYALADKEGWYTTESHNQNEPPQPRRSLRE